MRHETLKYQDYSLALCSVYHRYLVTISLFWKKFAYTKLCPRRQYESTVAVL
jgi:hypothetical protein